MGRNKHYIALFALIACAGTSFAQSYFDDVYYNPKKDKTTVSTTQKKQESYYISNMADMDVDAYNRRGEQYYVSQIDTIGTRVENGEDFVYTQQIQKYYNPTIVVDNANALGDILTNAYGNVDIIINANGYPVFAPYYGWNWPYYTSVWSPWNWGFSIGGWGWGVSWYNPWWGPGWWSPGPSWAWGPSWGWGYPWRPGPGWGPGPGPAPRPMYSYSPRGNRAVAPRPGWSGNSQHPGNAQMHRPNGGNYGGGNSGFAPTRAPGSHSTSTGRPAGVVNNNGRWEYNTTGQTGHRTGATGVLPGRNPQSTVNNGKIGNNRTTVTTKPSVNGGNTRTTTNNRSSVSNTRSTNSVNRSSMGGSHSSGGRSTGGRGGGGGGRHR